MNRISSPSPRSLSFGAIALCACSLSSANAQQHFSLDVDLDSGAQTNLRRSSSGGLESLSLDTFEVPFHYMNVATLNGAGESSGTIVRLDTDTGEILGEYRTAPLGFATNPSRTAFDSEGNLWVGNRDIERIENVGSVVKIGMVIGGKRCDSAGNLHPDGQYFKPPFLYSTAIDRDGDGLIRTSRGLGDLLDWNNSSDGVGGFLGGPAYVEDALDECILVYQKIPSPLVRHVTIDAGDDVWVGDTPANAQALWKLSGASGAILQEFTGISCVGIGGLVDQRGFMWSANEENGQVLRLDPLNVASAQCIALPSAHGLGEDVFGNIWTSQHNSKTVSKISSSGQVIFQGKSIPGAGVLRGVGCTSDGSVWVADSQKNVVFRLDGNGDPVGAPVPVGGRPTAVGVDARDRVWAVSKDSAELHRIDPTSSLGGAVDLVLPLTPGSAPQGYGSLNSTVVTDWALERGYWTVVRDSGVSNTIWTLAEWNASLPPGSSIRAFVRTAESLAELPNSPAFLVRNGEAFSSPGQVIEIQLRLISSSASHLSPIVYDLTLSGIQPGTACSTPNRRNAASLLLFPHYQNTTGKVSILSVTNTDSQDVDIEYVYINGADCQEFNRTETLTGHDTLTLLTSAHNPAPDQQGFVYVFAKRDGKAVTHNGLIGQLVFLSGMQESFDYSINAVGFQGIGQNGLTDIDSDGTRDLDGLEYSMAPDSLLIPRFFGQVASPQVGNFASRILMISLTGGSKFTTTVDILLYNDNEEVFSAEHSFKCWSFPKLTDLSNAFLSSFLKNSTNHDLDEILGAPSVETGWFRIDGAVASSSATSIPNPAIYAVLVDFLGLQAGADLPFELCEQPGGGLMHSGLHGDD